MTQVFEIKQGATFLVHGQCVNDDGTVKSLHNVTLSGQVRDIDNKLISDLIIVVTDEDAGLFTISVASTASWPEGRLFWDIKHTEDGISDLTETGVIQVLKAITR